MTPPPARSFSPIRRTRCGSGSGSFASSKIWSSGRTPPTKRCWKRPARRFARAGGAPARTTRTIPGRRSCSTRTSSPPFHDPFAGGGSIPLEAQRLGLEAYASDLNPVAVLINKAMIEIPPKFAGRTPVNPESRQGKGSTDAVWKGATGLAEDVRYYGKWMRNEAEKRIGHLYPKVGVTEEMVRERPDLKQYLGRELTVIAWLWARTVKSPNPAFANVDVPLASTFLLSTKKGKEAYVQPVFEDGGYRFTVKVGTPPETAKSGTKLARGANFQCVMSGTVINDPYIKGESMAGRMGCRLMAVVAEGKRGRVYLAPTPEYEETARQAQPSWKPDQEMNRDTSNLVSGRGYGFFTWADLFTNRQLVALTTFSDLVTEARDRIRADAAAAGMPEEATPLRDGCVRATAYAEAVGVYLAFAVDRSAELLEHLYAMGAEQREGNESVWETSHSHDLGLSRGSYLESRGRGLHSCCGVHCQVYPHAATARAWPSRDAERHGWKCGHPKARFHRSTILQ